MTTSIGKDQLDRLASDAMPVYQDAMRWFAAQGAPAAPLLVQGLEDGRLGATAHWRILLLLRELALPSTLPAILGVFRAALDERNPVVLPGAMEALAVFDADDALQALVSVLDAGDADFANHAAVLLGDRAAREDAGARQAEAALTALLARPDAELRASAVRGLRRAGTPSAHDLLRRHRLAESDLGVLALLKGLP